MHHVFLKYAVLTLALTSSTVFAHAQDKTSQTQPILPSIMVIETTSRDLVDRVNASGTIKPIDEVYIQPLVEGLSIEALNANIGDKVDKDAVLAVLSQDTLTLQKSQLLATKAKAQAALAQYQAQIMEAQANFDDTVKQRDRAKKLGESGSGSVSQVERATAAADVAKARLDAAEQSVAVAKADINVIDAQLADVDLRLSRTQVKTPVAGTVALRNANIGAIASGGATPLFTVIKDGAIELVADVSETDIQKIEIGQKVDVTLAGGNNIIAGEIRLVSPTVDPNTRLASVHIKLPNEGPARAGMFANAQITVDQSSGLALPLSAVTTGKTGSHTRLVKDGIVKQVSIETGIQDSGYIEVINGLDAGDLVVEKAGAFVRDGDRINPVTKQPITTN